MASKLTVKPYEAAKPADPPRAAAPDRAVYRLGGQWAVGVNWKLVRALGLAALVWVMIAAVLLSI
jgi:hypothetical protein